MTPAAKAVYLGALLIGLALGAFVGFRIEGSFLGLDYEGRRSLAPAAIVDFSNIQYRQADLEHAESALQMTVAFLENMEELKPEKVLKLDLAMSIRGLHCFRTLRVIRSNRTHTWSRLVLGIRHLVAKTIQNPK